jgi:hypothetical protein
MSSRYLPLVATVAFTSGRPIIVKPFLTFLL